MIASGIPATAAHLLSNPITSANEYIGSNLARCLEVTLLPFINYAVKDFLMVFINKLDLVREQVFDVVWQDYLIDLFAEKDLANRHAQTRLSRAFTTTRARELTQLPSTKPRVAEKLRNLDE